MAKFTSPINPATPTNEMGGPMTRGGPVIIDQLFTEHGETIPEVSKWISFGSSGDLVVEGLDGKPFAYRNHQVGDTFPVVARKVLPSFDFGGAYGVVTSTGIPFSWYGGH